MKKIIVFGATGNIGAYFIDYCKTRLQDEYEIIEVGKKYKDYFEKIEIKYLEVDL